MENSVATNEGKEADEEYDLQHVVDKKEDSLPFCPMVNGFSCPQVPFFKEKSGKIILVDIFFCTFAHGKREGMPAGDFRIA